MKKKNLNSLRLKKERISNLKSNQVTGGDVSVRCLNTGRTKCKGQCKTQLCDSSPLFDCTVTYQNCVTEPRFCGMF